ncbi:secreted RxLR effector peptide protein, putative [Phytophthora infestans T30-4]|uniref:RxLR effector protein n=1 Tax=Phytophthora infestans (strain T30-4) TaxID=403677 RepID=D0NDK4_PHYIT|nr:secreted RxLR effector peptide protein, putative [Phytophthora infestans T30-4]EEY56161.1 secreted RxLR effector peptide protein, putative [Phytophthora infestans T30-4]|eukprot:XP_002902991.1 secreted RxLR effector peptide protein, putative [Phytophthora infestans T30-4]
MRLAYIIAVVIAGALPSSNALHAVYDAKALNELKTLPDFASTSHTDGNRLLRRVDNEESETEEERVLDLKNSVKKLNPINPPTPNGCTYSRNHVVRTTC